MAYIPRTNRFSALFSGLDIFYNSHHILFVPRADRQGIDTAHF